MIRLNIILLTFPVAVLIPTCLMLLLRVVESSSSNEK